jgi:hypothetical protein
MEDLTLPSVRANFKRLERKLSKGFSQDPYSYYLLLLVGYSTCPPCPYSPKNFKHS